MPPPWVDAATVARPRRRLLAQSGLGVVAQLTQGIVGLSLLLVGHQTDLAVTTSALAVAGFSVGSAIGRPLQGRALDTGRPSVVLAACGVGHGVAFLLIAVAAHQRWSAAYIAFGVLAGALVPPIATRQRAAWPSRFASPTRAFAIIALLQTVSILIAPLLFTVVAAVASPTVAMLTVAFAAAASTVLFAAAVMVEGSPSGRTVSRVGVRSYARPLVSTALLGTINGVAAIAAPALALAAHHPSAAGPLVAATTAGALVGGLATMRNTARPLTPERRLFASAVVQVAGAVLVALPAPLGVAAAGMVLLGAGFAPALAASAVVVSARSAGSAESFGWQSMALGGGEATGSAVAGPLVHVGAHWAILPALVCALVCALLSATGAVGRRPGLSAAAG